MPLPTCHVNMGIEYRYLQGRAVQPSPLVTARPSVSGMPRLRDEDRQFAERLGLVLRVLREHAGWSRAKAAEELDVSLETLGKWERGQHAPKGYDLGRLYRGYERFGAEWSWFFDPPEVVVVNPVRDRLAELARGAVAEAREDLASEQERGRAAEAQRAARRSRRPA